MSTLWESCRSQFEALPAVADEWMEGAAEEFVRDLRKLVDKKRAWRNSALKLAHEIKYVHVFYEDLLVFFNIEGAFLHWSVMNCPNEEMDRVRSLLAEWREVLQQYSGTFPPPEENCQSYAAMQILFAKAQRAAPMILAGFRSLDACLAPRASRPEEHREAAADAMVKDMAA